MAGAHIPGRRFPTDAKWPQKSMTPVPDMRAAVDRLMESPLAGYPGYRPNSQVRRFRKWCRAELQSLKGVSTPMPSVPRRSEEQPSFIAVVRSELRAELSKVHRRQRDRRLASSFSPTKRG